MQSDLIDSVLNLAQSRGLLDAEQVETTRLDLEVATPPVAASRVALTQLRRVLEVRGVSPTAIVELLEEELARRADGSSSSASSPGGAAGPSENEESARDQLGPRALDPSSRDRRAAAPTKFAGGDGGSQSEPRAENVGAWCPPQYEVLDVMGTGAVGEVFKARDRRLGRLVALKAMHKYGPFERERFQAEARHQARIEHPSVCRVYEVGEHEGRPFLAMQLIEGQTLQEAAPGLAVEQKLELVRQVAEGVHAAHRTGLIHRDLKPSNIMVERTAEAGLRAYVLDFGIAREVDAPGLTRTGMVVGTPWYMAPEQISGRASLDRRTDVYGLGTVLFELFVGKPPFAGDSSMVVLSRILSEEPPRLRSALAEAPRDVERIVAHCLEKSPNDRYDSARDLAEDLARYLAGEAVVATDRTWVDRTVRWTRTHRALAAVSLVALLLASGLVVQMVRSRLLAERSATVAQNTGREVESLEWLLRASRQLPKHDLTPQKQELERRIADFRESADRLGPVGRRAGLYAVGRGALILEQLDEAQVFLERAWREGMRGAEIAQARGMTMGLLWDREQQLARSILDTQVREQRERDLEDQYLRPARSLLQEAVGAGSASGLLGQAWLDYFNGEDQQALQRARQVQSQAPWLHEALLLESRVLLQGALDAADDQQTEQARQRLEVAEEAFRRTLAVARSEARAYHGLCMVQVERLSLSHYGAYEPEPEFTRGLQWCGLAVEIDPQNPFGWLLRAQLHAEWGDALEWKVADTGQAMDLARSDALQALSLQPSDPSAYAILGIADAKRANELLRRGDDPREAVRGAIGYLELCIQLDPARTSAYRNIAHALSIEGRYVQGEKRIAIQREALDWLDRLYQRAPDDFRNFGPMANAWLQLADGLSNEGHDPGGAIDEAERFYLKSIEANPPVSWLRSNLSIVYLMRAREQARTGISPIETLSAAESMVRQALDLNDEDPFAWFNHGEVQRELARWRMLGLPPQGEELSRLEAILQRGREAYRRGLELAPAVGQAWVDLARFDVMAAEALLGSGRPAAETLQSARELLQRALEVDKRRASSPCELALVEALEAEQQGASARSNLAAFDRALSTLERCLDLDPWNADYLRSPMRAGWILAGLAATDAQRRNQALGLSIRAANLALDLQPSHLEAQAYRAASELLAQPADQEAGRWQEELAAAVERLEPVRARFSSVLAAHSP